MNIISQNVLRKGTAQSQRNRIVFGKQQLDVCQSLRVQRIGCVFLIAVFLSCLSNFGRASEAYYKEVRKSIQVNEQVTLTMDTHFANVDIRTAAGNKMEIVVKMDVTARDQRRADEMFDKFIVNISEGADRVGVSVGTGKWNCNGKNDESYNVSVEIVMPLKAILDGKCVFGDLAIGDMLGACLLDVEYGNAKMNGLWSYDNDFRVAFGNAEINGTNGGEFRNEYGKLELGLLQGNAEIKSSFGDLEIDNVAKECKDLDIHVQYAEAEVEIAPDAGFRIDARSSYSEIHLPSATNYSVVREDFSSKEVQGTIGNGTGKLRLECEFGEIDVDLN